MPQFQNITVKDRVNADKVYTPRDLVSGVATYVNSTGVPIGDNRFSISHTRTTANGREKVVMKLVMPVTQDVTVSGISKPTVVRTAYMDAVFTFEPTSNINERADIVTQGKNFLLNTDVQDILVNLTSPY